jgi:hypothetical protein
MNYAMYQFRNFDVASGDLGSGVGEKGVLVVPTRFNEDSRQVKRVSGDTVGPIRLRAVSGTFSAEVHDISITGAGLMVDLPFPVGSVFVIESGPSGRKLAKEITAELRYVTALPDGRWLLGCSFSRFLTADDMEKLG